MDDLYRAIEAAPDDPAPRLVLADLLQTEGDPRGTLIAAQYALEQNPDDTPMRAAVAKTLRTHADLVPLSPGFDDDRELLDLRWRWGFVERLTVQLPGWFVYRYGNDESRAALIREITTLLDHPSCRFLRHVVLLHTDPVEPVLEALRARVPKVSAGLMVVDDGRTDLHYASMPLSEAFDNPSEIRWVDVWEEGSLAQIADRAAELDNLEILRLHGAHRALPDGLGALKGLRRLDVNFIASLATLPDAVLANPSLRHLGMYDCHALQKQGYEMVRINQMLAGWERVHAARQQRVVELNLLLGRLDTAMARGSEEDLLRALDSNMTNVRRGAIEALGRETPARVPSGEVVLAGSFDLKKSELKALLTEAGCTVRTKPTAKTGLVLLGQNPRGAGLEALKSGRAYGFERDVLALRDTEVVRTSPELSEALRSREVDRTVEALDALKKGVLDDALIAEVLAVAVDTDMASKARNRAKKLFAVAASDALQKAVKQHFKQSPLTSGETKRVMRTRAIEAAAPEFDALTFSLALCARGGAGLTLIIERADSATIRASLMRAVKDGELRLGVLEAYPDELADLPIHTLWLGWSQLAEVPEVVCRMDQIHTLDLSENHLTTLPDLQGLHALKTLSIWGNRFSTLPAALRPLTHLETLEASATYDRPDLRALPEWIGELQSLKVLELRQHRFKALPDGLFALSNLESLDLRSCALPPPDARLAGLAGLKTLDIDYTDWRDHREAIRAWLPNTDITGG